jgi:molybdenum cofactor guanylyltransferase
MAEFPNITLAILAGGKASRMGGRNKALLEIDGISFINRIHKSLSPSFESTIIISNEIKDYNIPNSLVFPDIIDNIGPLGGIHSALVNSSNPFVFVVSCDMPFADSSIAKILVDEFNSVQPDILIPTINSYNEPLFAIYSKKLVNQIESIVSSSNGKPITDLLKISKTIYFKLPDTLNTRRCFTNINTLDDFMGL